METFVIIIALLWVSPEKQGQLSAFELTHLEGKPLKFQQMKTCTDHVYNNYAEIVIFMRRLHENKSIPFHIFCKGVVQL